MTQIQAAQAMAGLSERQQQEVGAIALRTGYTSAGAIWVVTKAHGGGLSLDEKVQLAMVYQQAGLKLPR